MNTNIRRLGVFFLIAFAIIFGDVTYWQVINASNMTARADNPRLGIQASKVRRGFIVDRNGKILAGRTIDAKGFVHRYYTDPALSEIVGYDSPRYGKAGIEQSFDSYLSGQVIGTSWTALRDQVEHKTIVGNDVQLTIDDNLQQQVTALLPDTPSAAIVADPRSGEILAMASKPGFDSSRVNDATYWNSLLQPGAGFPLIDRPIEGYYPPGSTFKVLTLSAALDTGIESLDTLFSGTDATGPLTVDYHIFCDNVTHPCAPLNNLPVGVGAVTLRQALEFSDNIVFAHVGLALGQQRFLDYTHRYGLDSRTPFDLPVSTSHVATRGEKFDNVELASTAFGQGRLNVTPLQMLMIAEAQATGGTIPNPVLVKQITDPKGSVLLPEASGTFATVESSSAAAQVKDAMIGVVQAGSGFQAQIPGIQVAGKTGTAETGDGRPPHAWFVCFAPADHPRVAVVVMVEHGGEGAFVAAPIAKRILEAALPLVH